MAHFNGSTGIIYFKMHLICPFLFAGGESSNTDFNERALDLRTCRRFSHYFRPFSSREGWGFFASSRPRKSADSLREDRESDDSLGEDGELADFLCEDREWVVYSAFRSMSQNCDFYQF